MSKHSNDMHDAADKAAKRIEPEPEPAERLCKIPGRVDRADLAVIIRAVTLHLAYAADLDDDSLEKSGKALADICRVYLRYERSPRHAGQTPPREGNQAGA